MKLLFDENLSPKLPNRLSDIFPNSLHVRDVGMKATIDPIVWDYAKDNDLTIISKDADMHDLSLVFGNPPKVIWLRLGNCSTSQVENLLRREFSTIELFYKDETLSLRKCPIVYRRSRVPVVGVESLSTVGISDGCSIPRRAA
jgi:predicted nuclease of predicted toxin-antitoxin system